MGKASNFKLAYLESDFVRLQMQLSVGQERSRGVDIRGGGSRRIMARVSNYLGSRRYI